MEAACRFEFLVCIYKTAGRSGSGNKNMNPWLASYKHLSSYTDYRIAPGLTKCRSTRVSHGTSVSLLKSGQRDKESPPNDGGGGEKGHQLISSQSSPARPSGESSIKTKVQEKNMLKLWQRQFEIRTAEFCLPLNNRRMT